MPLLLADLSVYVRICYNPKRLHRKNHIGSQELHTMQALLETLLNLFGYFEPVTSTQILAALGAVLLAALVFIFMYRAGRAASEGMGHLVTGLGQLLHAVAVLFIALAIFWLLLCLGRATLVHTLQ
jgi:hypothetical protein